MSTEKYIVDVLPCRGATSAKICPNHPISSHFVITIQPHIVHTSVRPEAGVYG